MIRTVSLALACAALSACVSVLPEPEPPEGLYRFGPMSRQFPVDATVAVREPEASRLFGGRAIAAEDSAGALRFVRGVEWADSATRLMQVASWLLLQRAANSGEMTVNQVMQERTKVRLLTPSDAEENTSFDELPIYFRDLVSRSLMMERDIRRLDEELYGDRAASIGQAPDTNPVSEQIALLKTVFGN